MIKRLILSLMVLGALSCRPYIGDLSPPVAVGEQVGYLHLRDAQTHQCFRLYVGINTTRLVRMDEIYCGRTEER